MATGNKKAKPEMKKVSEDQGAQEAPQEQKQATHVLYPINLVQAVLAHFTQTPQKMADVEGMVEGLRKGEQIAR
jgi:hypothetical protein